MRETIRNNGPVSKWAFDASVLFVKMVAAAERGESSEANRARAQLASLGIVTTIPDDPGPTDDINPAG